MPSPLRDWTSGPAKKVGAWTLAALACAGGAVAIRAADRASTLLIPRPGAAVSHSDEAQLAGAIGGLIDVNTATEAELELLPGIGPAMAARITEDRRTRGPFRRVEDLDRVPGIGARTVARLRPLVRVSSPDGAAPAP